MKNAYLRLARPLNCILASVSIPIVMVTLYGLETPSIGRTAVTIIGMLVVSFFTAGGNSLNDYFDREVDRINHPERPIPSKDISPESVLKYSYALFIISIALSLLLPYFLPQIIVLVSVVIMVEYELKLKKKGLVGNASIAWLTGALFVFAGAIYGSIEVPLVLGILAFLVTLGREIAKDIQDIKGDLKRNTFPMKVGVKRAKYFAAFFIIAAVTISPYPYHQGIFSSTYLFIVILADIIFIYSLSVFKNPKRTQKFIKLGMMVALIAFLSGGIL